MCPRGLIVGWFWSHLKPSGEGREGQRGGERRTEREEREREREGQREREKDREGDIKEAGCCDYL